ncbi:MAG: hypothetical protein ACOYD1_07905 [Candidatus Nanopelagicales bacterium]
MSDRSQPIEHGTYKGWQAEQRRGLPGCDACREARNGYMRGYRKEGSAARERNKLLNRARNAAISELTRRHPAEYRKLLDSARARLEN